MTNLKPCPFCGGEAERIDIPAEHDDIENAGASCIQCSRCVASTALHFDRKENLESSWNDRKPAPLALEGMTMQIESNQIAKMFRALAKGQMSGWRVGGYRLADIAMVLDQEGYNRARERAVMFEEIAKVFEQFAARSNPAL